MNLQNTRKKLQEKSKITKKITKIQKNPKKNMCINIHGIDVSFVFCDLNLTLVFCGLTLYILYCGELSIYKVLT